MKIKGSRRHVHMSEQLWRLTGMQFAGLRGKPRLAKASRVVLIPNTRHNRKMIREVAAGNSRALAKRERQAVTIRALARDALERLGNGAKHVFWPSASWVKLKPGVNTFRLLPGKEEGNGS